MKVLIDIPEKVFNEIVFADDTSHLSRAFLRGSYLYFKEALQNGTPIPDNATNGEVMCILFPKATLDKVMCIDMEWWNSPYKADKGVEE